MALDCETTIIYDDKPSLNQEDIKDLAQIIERDKRGEIKYLPFEEFDNDMKKFLKNLRAQKCK